MTLMWTKQANCGLNEILGLGSVEENSGAVRKALSAGN